jgi:hypothetical protein
MVSRKIEPENLVTEVMRHDGLAGVTAFYTSILIRE